MPVVHLPQWNGQKRTEKTMRAWSAFPDPRMGIYRGEQTEDKSTMARLATYAEIRGKLDEHALLPPSDVWDLFDWARDNGGEEWNSHLLPKTPARELIESIVFIFYETSTPIDSAGNSWAGMPNSDQSIWQDVMDLRNSTGRWTAKPSQAADAVDPVAPNQQRPPTRD